MTVTAKVRTLARHSEDWVPFVFVEANVLESPVGQFYTSFFADGDVLQKAIDCFIKNKQFELTAEFSADYKRAIWVRIDEKIED